MATVCDELVESYLSWVRDRISVADIDGVCEITTPFLDRHNDRLQIYVEKTDKGLRLTDDGYVIGDLEASGCSIDTPNRRALLQTVINGFGVHEKDGELFAEASAASFPQKKHALLQSMLAVNDMFMTARQRVATLFLEDVSEFLDEHEVRYAPSVEFTGKTGFTHKFDFLIPKSRRYPERLIRAINQPTRDHATSVLFAWTDTKHVRSPDSIFYVFLNDTERTLPADLLSAFEEYEVGAIPWSRRGTFTDELAA
jgi:hypothetical protein